jgi:FK506-binding nuclear protein
LYSRIEEVDEDEGPASKKRSADQMDEDPKPAAGGVSKTQQRKLNKKLKAEGGNAVPAGNAPAGEKKQGEKKPQSSGAQKEGKPKSGGDGKPKHEQSNGANGSGNQQKKDVR